MVFTFREINIEFHSEIYCFWVLVRIDVHFSVTSHLSFFRIHYRDKNELKIKNKCHFLMLFEF